MLEGLAKLKERLDGRTGVGAAMAGPVSVAIAVCGAENFLRWTRRHPDEIRHMMEIIQRGTTSTSTSWASGGSSGSPSRTPWPRRLQR